MKQRGPGLDPIEAGTNSTATYDDFQHHNPGQFWRLGMTEECEYCYSERIVPVLLKRIERSPKAGNKYRKFCLACERWLPFCAASDFKNSMEPHVLPADGDAENAGDHIIPLEDYDYGPEWADLVERATGDRPDPDAVAVTDGGQDSAAAGEVATVNRFECPECGVDVAGYPEECPECEAPYNWRNS